MINLVCFPHYTCGGLLCDILSDTYSPVLDNGGIASPAHNIGKISDTDFVLTNYDVQQFMHTLTEQKLSDNLWVGTHCWPGQLPLEKFDRVIVVSTSTYTSKLYRWARAYHHYFSPQWKNLCGIDRVDKLRETAKNYVIAFDPVHADNVENIEFADVVNQTAELSYVIGTRDIKKHMDRWKKINNFLYKKNFCTSEAANAFFQAEFELTHKRYYRYN